MALTKIKDPQEVVALYILPAIRSNLAQELKRRGHDQKFIARTLGVTEPAISQYINAKRATDTRLTKKMNAEISDSASRLTQGSSILKEAHRLVNVALVEGVTCMKCHELLGVPKGCTVCFEDFSHPVIFHETK